MAGHSNTTCVITSRIPIADVARLHEVAESRGSTVSALIAGIVRRAITSERPAPASPGHPTPMQAIPPARAVRADA